MSRGRVTDSILAGLASAVVAWPLTTLFTPSTWIRPTLGVIFVVVLAGILARQLTTSWIGVAAAQLVALVLASGWIYGRGSVDDKGGFYLLLKAATTLAAEGALPVVDGKPPPDRVELLHHHRVVARRGQPRAAAVGLGLERQLRCGGQRQQPVAGDVRARVGVGIRPAGRGPRQPGPEAARGEARAGLDHVPGGAEAAAQRHAEEHGKVEQCLLEPVQGTAFPHSSGGFTSARL